MTRHRFVYLMAAAVTAGLAVASEADAAFGNFNYATSVAAASGAAIPATPGNPASGDHNSVVVDIGNGNSITFAGNFDTSSTGINGTLPGGAMVNFANAIFTPASDNNTVTPYTVSYNIVVGVTDIAGGDTHFFDFTGSLKGNANGNSGSPPTGSGVNGSFFNFAVNPTSIPYTLGTYNASAPGGTGPGSSGLAGQGVVTGLFTATAVPVPSSVALLGLGGLGLLGYARRRGAAAR